MVTTVCRLLNSCQSCGREVVEVVSMNIAFDLVIQQKMNIEGKSFVGIEMIV